MLLSWCCLTILYTGHHNALAHSYKHRHATHCQDTKHCQHGEQYTVFPPRLASPRPAVTFPPSRSSGLAFIYASGGAYVSFLSHFSIMLVKNYFPFLFFLFLFFRRLTIITQVGPSRPPLPPRRPISFSGPETLHQ